MQELQEFWLRQKFLQKCWGSAYRWLTSILRAIGSVLSEEGGFELRGVVKLLVLSWGIGEPVCPPPSPTVAIAFS
jgi:hypothetical protein